MKKTCIVLAVSLLIFGSNLSRADEILEQPTEQQTSTGYRFYAQEFLKGFGAGSVAGTVVEFLRRRILPDITDFRLHERTGICRDQLTGEAKVAAALLGTLAANKSIDTSSVKTFASRIAGVIAGVCTASYMTKIVTGE